MNDLIQPDSSCHKIFPHQGALSSILQQTATSEH